MNRSMRALGLSVTLLALAAAAQAGTIYNNLGPGNSLNEGGRILEGEDVNNVSSDGVDQATRFNTGVNNHESISVAAAISVTGPLPFDGRGPLAIQIYSDSPTGPSALLASNTVNVTSYDNQLVSTSFPSLQLLANTNYWVVLNPETTFQGAWLRNELGQAGVTAGRSTGFPWNLRNPDPDGAYSLRVVSRVETVPEPATIAALGLGAVAMLRRRKRA